MPVSLPSPQTGFAIKGVPLVLIENYATGEIIARIMKAESAVCKTNFPSDPIYGGNSLYPHDYIDKDRTGTLDIATTRFQYGLAQAATGAKVTTGTTVTMAAIGEKYTIPAETTYTVTLKNAANTVEDSVKVYYADTDVEIAKDTVAAVGKYTYAAGVLTFAADDKSKDIIVDSQYTATTGDLVEVLTNGAAPMVKITLANEFQNQDGVKTREAIFVHKARSSGSLEHAEKRGTPGTPTLTFDLLDPERADNQLYTMGYTAVE